MRKFSQILALPLALALSAPGVALHAETTQPSVVAGAGRYDQQIEQEVRKYLDEDNKFANVRSSVDDGIVTLSGSVELYRDKEKVADKLRDKKHVSGVRNLIQVSSSVPDAELHQKLASKLRYDRINQGQIFNNFALGVQDGVVTVIGQVRSDIDRDSALAQIAKTKGVKAINDNIQVASLSPYDDSLRLRMARAVYGTLGPNYAVSPEAPVRIVVNGGHVALYGVVMTPVDKAVVLAQARSVPGAFSVEDHLEVESQQVR